jgi:hypothetical protein
MQEDELAPVLKRALQKKKEIERFFNILPLS